MPIYEYQCASCGKKTEFIQRFSDPQPVKCPSCGGALKKLLSSPTAHFKGSGFHATDYGRSGGKPEDSSKGENADVGASDAGAGTKSDSAGESAKDSGDSSKEKKDSKDSSKGRSDSATSAAKEAAHAKTSNAHSKKTSDPK